MGSSRKSVLLAIRSHSNGSGSDAKGVNPANWRRRLPVAVITVAALVAIIVWLRTRDQDFQWDVFNATFTQLDWRWMSGAVFLILLTYVGRVIRWEVMLRPLQPQASFWNLFVATVIGFTAVVLLGRPGELVRPYLISVKEKVPFSSQMAAWLLERIYDLLVVLIIFGFALSRMQGTTEASSLSPAMQWVFRAGGNIVLIISGLCLTALVAFGRFSDTIRNRFMEAVSFLPDGPRLKMYEMAAAFTRGTESTRSYRAVLLLVLYTTLEWMLIVGCYWCLFRSIPVTAHLSTIQVLAFLGFTAFGSVVQIPGIGGGVQVVAALVLTELFGVQLEAATGIAILIWLTTFVIIVPFGFLLAFREGIHWGNLRHLDTQPSP